MTYSHIDSCFFTIFCFMFRFVFLVHRSFVSFHFLFQFLSLSFFVLGVAVFRYHGHFTFLFFSGSSFSSSLLFGRRKRFKILSVSVWIRGFSFIFLLVRFFFCCCVVFFFMCVWGGTPFFRIIFTSVTRVS